MNIWDRVKRIVIGLVVLSIPAGFAAAVVFAPKHIAGYLLGAFFSLIVLFLAYVLGDIILIEHE